MMLRRPSFCIAIIILVAPALPAQETETKTKRAIDTVAPEPTHRAGEEPAGAPAQELAKTASETATAAAETAKAASETANAAVLAASQAKFADLTAGKLIQYGITAGYSFAIQTRSLARGTDDARQRSVAVTTMPYVVLVPGYWALQASSDTTAAYCAAAYGTDAALAAEAAANYARRKAVATLTLDEQERFKAGDGPIRQLVQQRADSEWNRSLPGRCGITRVGLFAGRPISYDASVIVGGGASESKEQVDSIIALGVAYVPNAYVTLLVGVSVNAVDIPGSPATNDEPETPDRRRRFVNGLVAFGGNIDILSALLK